MGGGRVKSVANLYILVSEFGQDISGRGHLVKSYDAKGKGGKVS